jgi:hypothetical protein
MPGKGFAYFAQEFTQLTWLSDNMAIVGEQNKQDSCQADTPVNIGT